MRYELESRIMKGVLYFWGSFESDKRARAPEADHRVCYKAPEVHAVVASSFDRERSADLEGEYGAGGLGSPTEVDYLEYAVGEVTR